MFKIWISLLFVLLLSFAINNTINAGVTAEDWNRHSVWIAQDMKGNWTPMTVYPPAFHVFMMPAVALFGSQIAWFQVVLAALANFVLLFIAHKYHGQISTLVIAILMLSNLTYLMYYDSLTPQTLDIILFPLFFYFLSEKRSWLALAALVVIGYSHQYGFVFLIIATIYSLAYKREFIKFLMLGYILLIPMFAYQYVPFALSVIRHYPPAMNAPGMVPVSYEMWATQETLYFEQPLNLLAFTGFVFPLTAYAIYRLYKDRKLFKISQTQKFYIIWAICFIPAMYAGIFRAVSYLVVPLMLLVASTFTEEDLREI